jgi:hypothetical protein
MSEGPIPLRLVTGDDDCRERRGEDRRAGSRAPHHRLDPLFAATLVAQIAPKEQLYTQGYKGPARVVRPGIVVNVTA